MYKLIPTEAEELLFSRLKDEAAQRYGAICYLCVDFGHDGQRFWETWYDYQPQLKTAAFRKEFNDIINSLRFGGRESPFESRNNLSKFCAQNPGKELTTKGNRYLIRTADFSYYFHCAPCTGNYEIHAYAYDNRYLLPAMTGQAKHSSYRMANNERRSAHGFQIPNYHKIV